MGERVGGRIPLSTYSTSGTGTEMRERERESVCCEGQKYEREGQTSEVGEEEESGL